MNKLVIASDGNKSAMLLDGVFFGDGIEELRLNVKGHNVIIDVLRMDVSKTTLPVGEEAEAQMKGFIEGNNELGLEL